MKPLVSFYSGCLEIQISRVGSAAQREQQMASFDGREILPVSNVEADVVAGPLNSLDFGAEPEGDAISLEYFSDRI